MRTLNKQIIFGVFILILASVGCFSCKCSHKDKNTVVDTATLEYVDSFPYPGVTFLLPTPSEVLYATFDNDVVFIANLTAPIGLEKKAIASHQQALLLGIYLTDLSYNIIFKNHQEGLRCINTIQNLSEKLGIGSVLYDRFLKRIENNFYSIDSMEVIFNDFSQSSFSVLENMGDYERLSLIAMGSGIEAMYIGYKSIDLNKVNDVILSNFLGQNVIYENYYKNFINYNFRNTDLKSFIKDVNIIFRLVKRNITVSNNVSVSEVKDSYFVIKDNPSKLPPSVKNIKELGDSILIVRENLINFKYQ